MAETRKIAAILVADIVGYGRLAGADEERTLARLRALRSDLIDPTIAVYNGRSVKRTGDGSLIEFRSVVDAVRCAIEVQNGMLERNAGLPPERRIEFRVGIHLGDVVEEADGDLMGDGVNIAARLESIADPGGVCISASAYEHLGGRIEAQFVDLGEKDLKNVARPVRVYAARTGPSGHSPMERSGVSNSGSGRSQTPRLTRIAAVGAAMLLCLGAVAGYLNWRRPALSQCAHASIAVLPFANLSGDPAQDYFSEGTTEDIIAALGRFSDLSVIAHAAVQKYKGQPIQLDEMSHKLGVCYVLEGSVRKNGDQALVTAQLIDASSGRLLWSESHDGEIKDLFAVRNQITQNVVGQLAIKLQDIETRRALKKPTESLDAYDYVLRGRQSYARNTRSANLDARRMFERAIQLDPAYASAYAALGSTRLNAATSGWTEFRDDALRDAEKMGQKAIELDADNAEAHRLLGRIISIGSSSISRTLSTIEQSPSIPTTRKATTRAARSLSSPAAPRKPLRLSTSRSVLIQASATVSSSSDGPTIFSAGIRTPSRRLQRAPASARMTITTIVDLPLLMPNSTGRTRRPVRRMTSGVFGRSLNSRNSSSSSRARRIAN